MGRYRELDSRNSGGLDHQNSLHRQHRQWQSDHVHDISGSHTYLDRLRRESFGSKCTSTGQTIGTIKTTTLVGHNAILEFGPPEIRGVLFTPSAGHFASFVCGGGLATYALNGNGIIAEMSAPTTCGAVGKTSSLRFESPTTGTPKWSQITTTGTKFDLTTTQNGGAATTAAQDGEGTVTFAQSMTFTC